MKRLNKYYYRECLLDNTISNMVLEGKRLKNHIVKPLNFTMYNGINYKETRLFFNNVSLIWWYDSNNKYFVVNLLKHHNSENIKSYVIVNKNINNRLDSIIDNLIKTKKIKLHHKETSKIYKCKNRTCYRGELQDGSIFNIDIFKYHDNDLNKIKYGLGANYVSTIQIGDIYKFMRENKLYL